MKYGVILDQASLGPDDLDLQVLQQSCSSWDIHNQTSSQDTLERCQHAELIISNKVVLNESTLSQCPRLKLVVVAATGTNNIDIDACQRLGIAVCNAPAYGPETVAQHTWALILALSTQLLNYASDSRNGQWSQSPFFCLLNHPITELSGKTLGIIGYGEIGRAVGRIAQAFGMQVNICQRPGSKQHDPSRQDFDTLLAQSDIVSLHCPLTPTTQHLINTAALRKMKPNAFLINCSRGGLIDERALHQALQDGVIAGAGLDGLSQEPPPSDHLLLQADLANLIITPHSAWASREARQRLVNILADNIKQFGLGQKLNRVDIQ